MGKEFRAHTLNKGRSGLFLTLVNLGKPLVLIVIYVLVTYWDEKSSVDLMGFGGTFLKTPFKAKIVDLFSMIPSNAQATLKLWSSALMVKVNTNLDFLLFLKFLIKNWFYSMKPTIKMFLKTPKTHKFDPKIWSAFWVQSDNCVGSCVRRFGVGFKIF